MNTLNINVVCRYIVHWYKMHAKTKTLIQIMMMRSTRPCMLTAGGLYAMNLESFGNVCMTFSLIFFQKLESEDPKELSPKNSTILQKTLQCRII